MNKIIWKDIDSTSIKGLLICELPAITKPKMRVQETAIDGVDGSIIEELGYETYDKSIRIGLTRDYDIDEVIKYFTGEGNVVFSNEPNKYYKAKIIEQIDYERLLRFREAVVKFRVQPFKYEYQEEETITATVTVEGTEIKITDAKATEIKIDGRSTQETRNSTNKFNASLIPASTGIVVNEDGSQIVMPTITTGNGAIYTGTKLSVLAPELKVGDTAHMHFERNPNVNINTQIYLKEANVMWYRDTTKTITQEMLDSEVVLYGNRFHEGETDQVTLLNFRMVLGESDAEWEQYGASPSPDYPSEIESVGYENLAKNNIVSNLMDYANYITSTSTGEAKLWWENIIGLPRDVELIGNWDFDSDGIVIENISGVRVYIGYSDGTYLLAIKGQPFIIPSDKTISEVRVYGNQQITYSKWENIIFTKVTEQHPYIPYGKYGIEVKTVGNNLLSSNFIQSTNTTIKADILNLKSGDYVFKYEGSLASQLTAKKILNGNTTNIKFLYNANQLTFTLDEDATVEIEIYKSGGITINEIDKAMLNKGTVALDYEPYQEPKTSIIELNAPLRSLPNGVKDIAYIRNNKLYVERKVGSVVLDGSENIVYSVIQGDYLLAQIYKGGILSNTKGIISSHFTFKINWGESYTYESIYIGGNSKNCLQFKILSSRLSTNNEAGLKTWLSTNNTQVDYELETPVTEEYGEFNILQLVDGENNISNSADANMVIDYIDNKLIINNLGNYISKPIFEIEGAGAIKFILNGYSLFTYNFDDDGKVVIDSEKEDAYLGTVLKNRNMNGEFPKLEIGENIITWDGLVKNIKVVKKSRWL